MPKLDKPKNAKTPKLGQHLLTNRGIARAMVEAGDVHANDPVLEVGPGKGMLTRELLNAGARVIAVEKDPGMISVLHEIFPKEIESGRLLIIEGDARDAFRKNSPLYGTVFTELGTVRYRVVANIPYYITGELLRLFLTAEHQPIAVALLVQKEVAERIARSAKGSLLSLSVKAYGTPRYVRTVKAGSFDPPPKVDSAILSISDISRDHFTRGRATSYDDAARERERRFFELVRAGFGQKRKTLLGNLKRKYPTSDVGYLERVWERLELNAKVRAEDVPLQTWLALAELFA